MIVTRPTWIVTRPNNTTTIETFFDRLREDHREFQREFRVHLKDERDREYAAIQQLLHNILETRVSALSREADAVAPHHEAQCRGADLG